MSLNTDMHESCTALHYCVIFPVLRHCRSDEWWPVVQKLTNFDMSELRLKLGPWVLGPFSIPSQARPHLHSTRRCCLSYRIQVQCSLPEPLAVSHSRVDSSLK